MKHPYALQHGQSEEGLITDESDFANHKVLFLLVVSVTFELFLTSESVIILLKSESSTSCRICCNESPLSPTAWSGGGGFNN